MSSKPFLNPLAPGTADSEDQHATTKTRCSEASRCPFRSLSLPWGCCRGAVRLTLIFTCALFLSHSLLGMLRSPTSTESRFLSECMHPMGGGLVGSGGNFSPLNATKSDGECAAEMAKYFETDVGQYYVDVARVATAARAHFDALPDADKPHFNRVIVFDIDETTLSNAVEFTGLLSQYRRTAPCGVSSFLAQVFGQQQKLPEAAASVTLGRAPLGATDRPALAAMLDLYMHLYNSGYSVAFITGRTEEFRAGTEDNLAAAGYGRQCDMLPAGDVREEEPNHVRTVNPCYVQLFLRTADDKRPASAYKPDQRKALEAAAYTVFGNFGDQFSDLDGLHVTPHSFKLPNPGYLIL